jgi:glucose-6-phosphate 1-epimerase
MEKLLLQSKDGASAEIYLQGAHVSSWIPADGKEQLFLSKNSNFQQGVAIRGGVPIIFPQFAGLGSLPKHGFARNTMWNLMHMGHLEDGAAFARFSIKENIERLLIWPQVFTLEYQITVAEQSLLLEFHVLNNGDTPFQFTSALHTYFQIDNIEKTYIRGLGGLHYRDTVINQQNCLQEEDMLTIDQEIDRIYAETVEKIVIEQMHQQLEISQTGFQDAVVWNPWKEKAAQLNDLEAHEYQHFVCVEAASILKPIVLKSREAWKGSQEIVLVFK